MFGQRILILVPHPDDEVVACAASIRQAKLAGSEVFALYLTHGCLAKETMWKWQRRFYEKIVTRRLAEAEQVAKFLNLEPVGWSHRPARHLWREMDLVEKEIRTAIDAYAIDQLWVPAYEGGNSDHDGLNALAQKFVTPERTVLEFAEYNFLGGEAQANRFPFPNGSEQTLILSDFEYKWKGKALALYQSEKSNLDYVGLEQECYRPLANYDYGRPPHRGKLWYARFQWVPFKHPRVDFTQASELSAAITLFLSKAL